MKQGLKWAWLVAGMGVAASALAQSPGVAPSVGRVLAVAGTAVIERNGQQQAVDGGAEVFNGDVINVGERSALQVRFTDESIVALRANSLLRVQDFRYAQDPQNDRSLLALLRGGLRTITGLIGRVNARAYGVKTATSTVGIRGTHFTLVACSDDCFTPDGAPVPNGLFGGVADGRISVTNDAGESLFDQQEHFYLADAQSVPQRLLVPPAVLLDPALVTRGRRTGGTAAEAPGIDSSTEQRSSSALSTSPQTGSASATGVDVQVVRASLAVNPFIGVSDQSYLQNQISYAEAGLRTPNGVPVAESKSEVLTVGQIQAQVPEVSGKYFFDANTLAAQLRSAFPVEAVNGTGVYLAYQAPKSTDIGNSLGSHLAFGDTPRIELPTSGTALFSFAAATAPTDNLGRTGVTTAGLLSMDFLARQGKLLDPITVSFGSAAGVAPTSYVVAAGNTWTLHAGAQSMANVQCTGCNGTPVAILNGRIVGITAVGFAASLSLQGSVGASATPHVAGTALAFGRR